MKRIIFSTHARERMRQRGASEAEVRETIGTAKWKDANLNRKQAQKAFPFDQPSPVNKQWYKTKIVRAFFKEQRDAIVIVSVLVYYEGEVTTP